ncbi:hypothetical protein, partial [Inquilinus limosus]|uniref:hypothetical protein n=1 Tax=Inquilinus limosus TaxID=171674 RepID=UPI001C5336A9
MKKILLIGGVAVAVLAAILAVVQYTGQPRDAASPSVALAPAAGRAPAPAAQPAAAAPKPAAPAPAAEAPKPARP